MPVDADHLRNELREIGERRSQIGEATVELVEDTRKAIKRARGVLSMTEIAALVRLERTSMYHTYGSA